MHSAQTHLCDCPGAVAEEVAEDLDWVSLPSETEKVPPIHCGFSCHIPSYLLTSTVVKRDLSPSSWRPALLPGLEPISGQLRLSSFGNDTSHLPITQPEPTPQKKPKKPNKKTHVLHGVYPLNASSPVRSTARKEGLPGIQKMEDAFQEKYKTQLFFFFFYKYINKGGGIP